ncbi:MAG: DUF2384 domain-containing protein [Gammaproteobacteria bacterium]|nr:DUF2384 domain-containing protein [Gammaproteobacteria bacterium]
MLDPASANADDRARVLSRAVVEAAARLQLRPGVLRQVLGISQPTASRLLHGRYQIPPESKTWELAALFVRLYRALFAMVGGNDEFARLWLETPNRAFDDRAPAEVIQRIDGLLHACEYVDAHRARV